MKFVIVFLLTCCLGVSTNAANIVIVNLDDPGEGFNDTTPATPEGGNTGTTRGQQRLIVFQTAAKVWGALLKSNVTIHVGANFDPLTPCSPLGSVLGSAGPSYRVSSTPPAGLIANTWYPIALYESYVGANANSANNEITAKFNSDIDDIPCGGAGTRFWYGIDPNTVPSSGTFFLFRTVLHELGHGLGFASLVCKTTSGCSNGVVVGGFAKDGLGVPRPDAWAQFVADTTPGYGGPTNAWDTLTDAQRAASMTHDPKLIWIGPNVTADASSYQPTGSLAFEMGFMRLHAPSTIAPGSSVSHWSSAASNPNLLMEPALQNVPSVYDADLTYSLLQDIGWRTNPRDTLFEDSFDTQ